MEFTALAVPKEEVLVHFSHPHPLQQVSMPYLFTCMGCKEYGAGRRFRCQACNFDLHDFCALAPPSIQSHPLHSQHQLIFYTKVGGLLRSKCEVCNKTTKGYTFRCPTCNFEVHPGCTLLQQEMDFPTHLHTLFLSPATATPGNSLSTTCAECRRKRSGQFYHCAICGYHIHAVCAKDMVNGLYVHGLKAPEKPSMLGAAAGAAVKLASHAVAGFLGGLVDGIGEGVGEYIADNIGKGGPAIAAMQSSGEGMSRTKVIAPKEGK
ncbi:hypothetical protein MRB53_005419 [Persea americana]|uniref:Uncharacterized protein n=1 Tax=Persea americana TaxID=3435 RepID=A0ACC2ME67_PERAE|nr:hypothetical protein MRB53_005419 [Persea americana]